MQNVSRRPQREALTVFGLEQPGRGSSNRYHFWPAWWRSRDRVRHACQAGLFFWILTVAVSSTPAAEPNAGPAGSLASYDPELQAYGKAESRDPVGRLAGSIASGKTRLTFDPQQGYLSAVLAALDIRPESQLLVFSKSSLQRYHISSKSPRAIYFNDQSYVAWIPGAPLLELLSFDPQLGAVLYTLDQTPNSPAKLTRDNRCLECHITTKTLDIPGAVVRSFRTTAAGDVDLLTGTSPISHRTPFEERWGGWFITGVDGKLQHRGNLFLEPGTSPAPDREVAADLHQAFDARRYLRETSDAASILVFEHQTHMANLISRLAYESRAAERVGTSAKALHPLMETVLKYLLFVEEAPFPQSLNGRSQFEKTFAETGPRDRAGRSLRTLNLKTRLFEYPCSYLIYSPAFEQLPAEVKKHLYRRLWTILNGEDNDREFRSLSIDSRRAILDILLQTKTDLPAYWKL